MKHLPLYLGLLLLNGCFTYSSKIELMPTSGIPVSLDADEHSRVNEIVASTASRFGLILDSRLPDIARTSREDHEWKEYVEALYSVGQNAPTSNRVALWIVTDKQTGQQSIVIRDLDSVDSTQFTVTLESSLAEALSQALPSRKIQVQRETLGPSFGP